MIDFPLPDSLRVLRLIDNLNSIIYVTPPGPSELITHAIRPPPVQQPRTRPALNDDVPVSINRVCKLAGQYNMATVVNCHIDVFYIST